MGLQAALLVAPLFRWRPAEGPGVELRVAGAWPPRPTRALMQLPVPRPSPRASPPCPPAIVARLSSRSSDSVSTAAAGGLFATSALFAWASVVEQDSHLHWQEQELPLQEQHLQRQEQEQEPAKQRMPCNYCSFPLLWTT